MSIPRRVYGWAAPVALALAVVGVVAGSGWVGGGHGDAPLPKLHLVSTGATGATADTAAGHDVARPNGADDPFVLVGELPHGLPGGRAVWHLSAADATDAGRLTRALGLTGAPVRVHGGWVSQAGERQVVLRDDGSWTYGPSCTPEAPAATRSVDVMCAVAAPAGVATAEAGCDADIEPCSDKSRPGGAPPARMPPGPSETAARAAAAPVLDALGLQDPLVTVSVGAPVSSVQADPRLGGLSTVGWSTFLQINGAGRVDSASGRVGSPVAGRRYPLVSAGRAFQIMQAQPRPMTELCAARKGGKPGCAAIPPTRITGASLGLSLTYDGPRAVLVPSWLFHVEGQSLPIAQVAVNPAFLAPPTAYDDGGAGPGAGSGSGGSSTGSDGGTAPDVVTPTTADLSPEKPTAR